MRTRSLLVAAVGLAMAAGGVLLTAAPAPVPPPPPVLAATDLGIATDAPAPPVAVHIPRLGVRSPLVGLDVDAAGVLEPPATADVAGWHTAGTVPGEIGPAVVAGHVDSRSGPGIFIDVATLRPEDTVEIERADGDFVTFAVQSVETVDKQEFPTTAVYGPTPVPELRLITCGGFFDAADGHYTANVIVRAVRTDTAGTWTFGA